MEYPDVRPVTTPSGLLSLEGVEYYSLAGPMGDFNLGMEGLGLGVECLWTLVQKLLSSASSVSTSAVHCFAPLALGRAPPPVCCPH